MVRSRFAPQHSRGGPRTLVSRRLRRAYHRVDDSCCGRNEALQAHAKCGEKATTIQVRGPTGRGRPALLVRQRAARPAVAGAQGPHARPLSGLAVRGDAAADHGQGGHPLLRGFLARWPNVEALAGRVAGRRARGLGGARLLQPRPQPAQMRPGRRRASWAAASRRRRRGCARCRASAPTRRRRSLPSPSARAPRPSTATSSAWSPGCSRWRHRCRPPSPRSGGLPRR